MSKSSIPNRSKEERICTLKDDIIRISTGLIQESEALSLAEHYYNTVPEKYIQKSSPSQKALNIVLQKIGYNPLAKS